ncbi:alanine/glycine:cation symporter family protein [Candidatus Margulisiibacteriota bacterium]
MIGNTLSNISNIVWGPITIVLLVGTGIFLTIRLKLIQARKLPHAFALISGKYDDPKDKGEITHFQALSTALAATIGTGNIAGVATAIAVGGPGAVFWMWITAIFGMATKYTSCLLALNYRIFHKDGTVSGGPMYFLEKGLGQKWLAVIFAFCTAVAALGIGNMVQSNSVADALRHSFKITPLITGIVMAVLVWLVVVGGIKRIGHVASRLVPTMCVLYILGAVTILIINFREIPNAFYLIFKYAFTPTSLTGGFLGSTVAMTIRMGVARGVFSNESGLGSAPIAHAAARTNEPVREGLVAMTGPLIDTLIICSMTALVIITSGLWNSGVSGTPLTARAFAAGLPMIGEYIVTIGIMLFAFSTVISWCYYGERGAEYLFGEKVIRFYRWLYVLVIPLGAYARLITVWSAADIANGLMAFPNLIGLIGLSGVAVKLTRNYFKG